MIAGLPKLTLVPLIPIGLAGGILLGWAPVDRAVWVGTWSASLAGAAADAPLFKDQTVREIVHTSAGGKRVRVRLSNQAGTQRVVIGAAHLALRASGSNIVPSSDRILTFNGSPTVVIPPGLPVLSDPVALSLPARADLSVSLYFPSTTPVSTVHWAARQTSYIAQGNLTGAAALRNPKTMTWWPFLAGVDVVDLGLRKAIVAFGDSITDGDQSTQDANRRWPDMLAARLQAPERKDPIAVLNAGIGGNRILHDGAGPSGPKFGISALARFDRDVLAQPGVKYVIVLEGINDIGQPDVAAPASERVTADEIIFGLGQLIGRAHKKDLRIFGGTLTPFEGAAFPGYYTPEREVMRQIVNRWIRATAPFDAVIDFDAAVRDPNHPTRLLPRYDSGDHIHPNDAGYRAMGEAVDLSVFARR